jgi:hypothetical protein
MILNVFKLTTLLLSFFISCLFFETVHAQNTILNGNFESGTDSNATNWSAFDGAERTNDFSNTGNYSMSVWNWYAYAEGKCVNGNVGFEDLDGLDWIKKTGTPFIYKPIAISGVYKYDTTSTYSDNDSAIVEIFLKKFNPTTQSIDTIGMGIKHLPATQNTDGFIPFEVPIIDLMPGYNPDSIVIRLQSSINGFCDAENEIMNCLYFYVDDLLALFPLGLTIPVFNNDIIIAPNPVKNELQINLHNQQYANASVINLSGKVILTEVILDNDSINVSKLNSGTYLLKIESEGPTLTKKFIKY